MSIQLLIAIVSSFIFLNEPEALKELLPDLWVGEGLVEFEGSVPIDCHHPDTPDVYLEMLVTAPDSREHESVLVASIQPSLLHAALLAAGAEPGSPTTTDADGTKIHAYGDQVRVFVSIIKEGQATDFVPIESWVVHTNQTQTLQEEPSWEGLVFAGSRLKDSVYAADREGTLISLYSFGNEVIAPIWSVSHEAQTDEPVWIANRDRVPKKGTRVRVRLELIQTTDDSHEPDRVDIDRDM